MREAARLVAIRSLDEAGQRDALRALRAGARCGGANWWLGVIQGVTPVDLDAVAEGERRDRARLGGVALCLAGEYGELGEEEVVTRLARLAVRLSRYDRPEAFGAAFEPDAVARRCLAGARMSAGDAAGTRWELRTEDVPVLRRLRRARNVMHAAVGLMGLVRDEATRRELAAWRAVLPRLP